jgi:hypothetical protein
MRTALHMAADDPALEAAVKRSRKLLNKRALVAAAASAVPVPGLDWAVDAAMLSKLIPEINREFGLSPAQLDQLDPKQRDQVQKAVAMVGSVLIGKFISKDLLITAAQRSEYASAQSGLQNMYRLQARLCRPQSAMLQFAISAKSI